MEHDEESGLNYHSARYCADWLGKWISPDPSGLKGGINLYRYANCGPIVYSDKSGATPDAFDTFDEYLPGLITDYPRLGQEWDSAAETVLENRYGKGSAIANKKAFYAEIDKLPEGPKRSELARKVFDSVRQGFYRRVGKLYKQGLKVLGGRDVPADTIEKMIKGGTRPAPGTQIDHAIQELALEPKRALDPTNLGARKGHAGVPGGSHYEATEGRKKLRESKLPGGTGSSSSATSTAMAAQMFTSEFMGASADPFEKEIDDMKQWGFDMLTSLAREGPAGVFRQALDPVRLGKVAVISMQSPHMFGARGGLSSLATECMNPAKCMPSTVDRSEALKVSQAIVQQLNDAEARKAAEDPWYGRDYYTLDVSVLSSSNGRNYAGPLAGRSYLPIYVYR
jgi:RHS repeat-associated protein